MKTICINGTELQLNTNNADVMERVESSLALVRTKITECSTNTEMKVHEKMRIQCGAMLASFDSVFGEGTSSKVVQDPLDYMECFSAYAVLAEVVIEQQDELTQKVQGMTAKYSPNRAARRATAKK